jgi:uncharacterized protein
MKGSIVDLQYQEVNLQGERFWLLPQRAILWESKSTLILSDLHLGEETTSAALFTELRFLLQKLQPHEVIILGDLFAKLTPAIIASWLALQALVPGAKWQLVMGNHEIFPAQYRQLGIETHRHLYKSDFNFWHQPLSQVNLDKDADFTFAGHLHPAIYDSSLRKQQPCFWIQCDQQLILPAFNDYYAKFTITPQSSDSIYVISENHVESKLAI